MIVHTTLDLKWLPSNVLNYHNFSFYSISIIIVSRRVWCKNVSYWRTIYIYIYILGRKIRVPYVSQWQERCRKYRWCIYKRVQSLYICYLSTFDYLWLLVLKFKKLLVYQQMFWISEVSFYHVFSSSSADRLNCCDNFIAKKKNEPFGSSDCDFVKVVGYST